MRFFHVSMTIGIALGIGLLPLFENASAQAYTSRGTKRVQVFLQKRKNAPARSPLLPPVLRSAAPMSRFAPQKNYRRGGGGGGGVNRTEGSGNTSSSSANLIAPTITFSNLTKSHIDANFSLSPTSDSPGAFTFTSGNTSLVSISGNTADIVGTHGTVTITAHQAASGNFAAGTASMTLTVFLTYCVSSPCLFGGECIPTLEGALTDDNFVCICPEDTSGDTCEIYDDNCESLGYCNSGECIPDASGGSCGNCAPCLEGDRCQTAILNCESRAPMLLACVEPTMSRLTQD